MKDTMTASEYRSMKGKKQSKYKNVKVTVNGITFDSKREYKRYLQLKELQDERLITELELQVKFEVIPKTGKEQACNYIADFMYRDGEYNLIIEDSKGKRTPDYIIKRKLMNFVYGIEIHEV